MQENQTPGAEQENQTQQPEKAPKAKEVKPEKAVVKKLTPEEKQFQVELEKLQFSDKGKKLSKASKQFMSVNAFIHFLKNGKFMGWNIKVVKTPAELSENQKAALNQAVEEWNKAQPIDPETKQGENQVSKF